MLWIALYFHDFPLQIIQRCNEIEEPLVIVDGPANRQSIIAATKVAKECGLHESMAVSSAQSLCSDVKIRRRDTLEEIEKIRGIAAWALQYTPNVSIQDSRGLLLEVSSTLTLHRGLDDLLKKLSSEILSLGYIAHIGVAPIAITAWIFAKAHYDQSANYICTDFKNMTEVLHSLPLKLFDWSIETVQMLKKLGIRTIKECMQLPRDGFVKRFGKGVQLDLDKANGRMADPRAYFIAPEKFSSKIEFEFEVNDVMALLFPIKRMLQEMVGFLRGRCAGVQEWTIEIWHLKQKKSIHIRTAMVEQNVERMLVLCKEHLAKTLFSDTIIGLHIYALRLLPFQAKNISWLLDANEQNEDWMHLVDKLTSRLGREKVYQWEIKNDHRPEHNLQKISLADKSQKKPRVNHISTHRPLFLLDEPKLLHLKNNTPLYKGILTLLSGPERMEGGWWDRLTAKASRDYYVARNPKGETLWIYLDHQKMNQWYLHGIFS